MKFSKPEILKKRAQILRETRRFFDERGYTEIEAPLAVLCPGLELHLDAFELAPKFAGGARRHLHTSPEYALKKLLGQGMDKIYSLGPCFRDEPMSSTHSPEFTMLEWYEVGLSLQGLIDQTAELIGTLAQKVAGSDQVIWRGKPFSLKPPFEQLTVQEAFLRYAGVDPFELTNTDDLRNAAKAHGVAVPTDSPVFEDVFFQIFLNAVEPHLGVEKPTFLTAWPKNQAALARIDPENPKTALRFELYAGGIELCNAFDELCDPVEQRARFEAEQNERREMDRPIYPIDERLLEALSHMKQTSGIAIGFDRLVMLLTGVEEMADCRAEAWE